MQLSFNMARGEAEVEERRLQRDNTSQDAVGKVELTGTVEIQSSRSFADPDATWARSSTR